MNLETCFFCFCFFNSAFWIFSEVVYLQRWCHMKLRRVNACLAVTCHLHFWQNDRDLLRAIAVTRVSTKSNVDPREEEEKKKEKKIPRRDSNPWPFDHGSGALTTELSPLPDKPSYRNPKICLCPTKKHAEMPARCWLVDVTNIAAPQEKRRSRNYPWKTLPQNILQCLPRNVSKLSSQLNVENPRNRNRVQNMYRL